MGPRALLPGNSARGFTLIELVCTLIIIGILMGGILPRFSDIDHSAHSSVVDGVMSALVAGHGQAVLNWYVAGSPGNGSTTLVNVPFGAITVRYRDGNPNTTTNSAHIPAGTPGRSSAQARLFFLFLDPVPQPIIEVDSPGTGWVMLGTNAQCALAAEVGPNPRRCWEYRVRGERFARISYSSSSGQFYAD